ncbi:hypothetical protein XENTR_v10000814 [Xenopus tropicalis]|nr:hypothetical protein XENTR_v10000814 [Xenopus tropicalis]
MVQQWYSGGKCNLPSNHHVFPSVLHSFVAIAKSLILVLQNLELVRGTVGEMLHCLKGEKTLQQFVDEFLCLRILCAVFGVGNQYRDT